MLVALLAEGVDRNVLRWASRLYCRLSPSSRRAWIEIADDIPADAPAIVALLAEGVDRNTVGLELPEGIVEVALLAEGVDRNF